MMSSRKSIFDLQQTWKCTSDCERILRRRDTFRDRQEANAWEAKQPWRERIVRRALDARWWIWWVTPEGWQA